MNEFEQTNIENELLGIRLMLELISLKLYEEKLTITKRNDLIETYKRLEKRRKELNKRIAEDYVKKIGGKI